MTFPMHERGGRRCGAGTRAPVQRRGALAALLAIGLVVTGAPLAANDASAGAESAPPGRIEFVGHNLFGDANGTFHRWRVVESDEASLAEGEIGEIEVVVEVDLASVDTGTEGRDDHLRTADFFEVETYPVARVRAGGLTPKPPAEQAEDPRPEFSALFEIDLHGVTRTVVGTVWLASEDPPVFEGELVLDRTDFGIGDEPSFWNPMSIDAEVPVRFVYAPMGEPNGR